MFSMFLVCLLHTVGQGGILGHAGQGTLRYAIALFFQAAAMCCVDAFALISGHVGVVARFRWRNLLRLWLQALFYCVGCALLFRLLLPGSVSLRDLASALFPFSTGKYWYLTAYAQFFLAIPLLNFVLQRQAKEELRLFLWVSFLAFSLFSCLPFLRGFSGFLRSGYCSVWLAYLYILGGFLRLHGFLALFPRRVLQARLFPLRLLNSQGGRLSLYGLCVLTAFLLQILLLHLPFGALFGSAFLSYLSPFTLGAAVALLEFFARLKPRRGIPLIRLASPLAFGVYLVHVHPLVWTHLMKDAFVFCLDQPLWLYLPLLLIIPLGLYLACSLADFLRQKLFQLLHLP